ncbi:MAG: cation:proton antiporter [candidate division Zixibacteria bacterium]|nr:cation:proton antiporter [candidate division Zixibacteria bacterium]
MKRILPLNRFIMILGILACLWISATFFPGLISAQHDSSEIGTADSQIAETDVNHSTPPEQSTEPEHQNGDSGSGHGSSEVSDVLLGLIIILLAAKIGGDLLERLHQPAVLGELIIGMVIGNLALVGIDVFEPFKHSVTLEVLAEIGVIILLFQVGLESTIGEMMKVGLASFMVAVLGVVAPFFLGWGVGAWFLPHESIYVHVFIGATLTATSVGITARVLKDIGKIQTKEAKIILGAAVIDDIMGLVILAVVAGVITAASSGIELSSGSVFLIVAKAVGFVIGSLILGRIISPYLFKIGYKMKVKGMLLSLGLLICFIFAYVANLIGLAPIVGAFAAGLVLEKIFYKDYTDRGEKSVDDLIEPIAIFLVPVFFVRMGMMVQLDTFANVDILLFAGVMTIAAIIGKQACSLAIFDKSINRVAIGLGMIPRGEVGLIFVGIGAKLVYDGHPVITAGTFSAVVIMVMITTLVTPPFLKLSMLRGDKKK